MHFPQGLINFHCSTSVMFSPPIGMLLHRFNYTIAWAGNLSMSLGARICLGEQPLTQPGP